jgi:tetratricopeptide (TPR) repeat protein
MTKEEQQIILEDDGPQVPSDNNLAAEAENITETKTLSEQEYTSQDPTNGIPSTPVQQHLNQDESFVSSVRLKRFSGIQKVLAVGIVLVTAVLVYELTKTPSKSGRSSPRQTPQKPSRSEHQVKDATQKAPHQNQEPQLTPLATESLSLKLAESFYLQGNYEKACNIYDRLRQSLPTNADSELLRDFLQLKMALCVKRTGDAEQANHALAAVVQSRSPILKILANYYLSSRAIQQKQYLKAAARAYQAIALIEATNKNSELAQSLERNCRFLVAEAISRKVLSLCDIDKDIPPDVWDHSSDIDHFANLKQAELHSLLNSGVETLSKALLGPQITISELKDATPRCSIICCGAPIEELFARFAGNTGLDIHWACGDSANLDTAINTLRKRPVTLYISDATAQQFATVAAGCVGLSARLDDKATLNISDLYNYKSLSQHVDLLIREAVSVWRRFLIIASSNQRKARAHFALGLLYTQTDQLTDAIAEYKLVANRFSHPTMTPLALLYSSKLKTTLHDHLGAREDLRHIMEQYPDSECSDRARLSLADATTKAELYDEAAKLYRNAYNIGLSSESQAVAALGAGKCFYKQKDYDTAEKWLTRYISLAKDRTNKEFCSACLLLGKTASALGKHNLACDAFKHALTGPISRQLYLETISALVKTHIQQGQCIEALNVLENVHHWKVSQNESVDILLLKVSVLRSMGLFDKAIAALGDKAKYLTDNHLKAKIALESAKCTFAKGDLEQARDKLTALLVSVEPGPLAQLSQYHLARVCLKLDQNPQAISLCLQLLNSSPSQQIKQETLETLATAYRRQKDYDKTAMVLLGRWGKAENTNTNDILRNPTAKSPTLNDDTQ